jgi:hypothetical protein
MKLRAIVFAVVQATPDCDEFAAHLPKEALDALKNACQNGSKAWFCDNCKIWRV